MAYQNGLRPGLHGQTLLSTGLQDFDQLMGGGLPLEGILLVVEDGVSGHHKTLTRYFLAEGVACGHSCFLATADQSISTDIASWLPKEGKPTPSQAKEDEEESQKDAAELRIAWQYRRYIKAKQDEDEAAAEAKRKEQKAASGFRRAGSSSSVKTGASLKWCHDYDLTKPMGAAYLRDKAPAMDVFDGSEPGSLSKINGALDVFLQSHVQQQQAPSQDPSSSSTATSASAPATDAPATPVLGPGGKPLHPALAARLAARQKHLQQQQGDTSTSSTTPSDRISTPASAGTVASISPKQVCRIAMLSLGSELWDGDETLSMSEREQRVFSSIHKLKWMLKGQRACAVVTVSPHLLSTSLISRLQYLCSGAISFEAVGDLSDIVNLVRDQHTCAGLLRIAKLPVVGSLAPQVIDVDMYLLRHRRRRIAIQPIEFDPDSLVGGNEQQQPQKLSEPSKAATGLEF